MLYREIIAVCAQIHTKNINTLCEQNVELYIKIQSVPHSKHNPSRLQETISYCCIGKQSLFVLRSTQKTNTLCGQNVELYIKTQSVPRSKHTPSLLQKLFS